MQGKNPTNLKLPKHVLASQQFNARHRSADEIRLEEGTSFGIISQFSSKHGGGPCQVPSCRHYSTDHAFYGKSHDACGTLHCSCELFQDWPLHHYQNFNKDIRKLNNNNEEMKEDGKTDIKNDSHLLIKREERKIYDPSLFEDSLPKDFDKENPHCYNCGHLKSTHNRGQGSWNISPNDLTLSKQIGTGQFSNVYLGTLWGKDVAVKKVRKKISLLGESDIEMLFNEINIMSNLHHPNLVSLVATVTNPNNFMIITEYCGLGALSNILLSDNVIEWSTLLGYTIDIGLGMNYIHHNNILHRDLKSDNILDKVSLSGVCKIGDFGLSTFLSTNTRKMRYGTPFWMAPEVINNFAFSSSSDVFSFGIVLSEIFSREFPYGEHVDNFDEEGIMKAVLLKKLRPSLPSWIPNEVVSLIHNCWNSEKELRPDFDSILLELNTIIEKKFDIVCEVPKRQRLDIYLEKDETEIPNENKPTKAIEIDEYEIAKRQEEQKTRIASNKMRNFFRSAIVCQASDGSFPGSTELTDCWGKIGGINIIPNELELDDTLHFTLSTVTLIQWVWNWFSQIQTNVLETHQIDIGKTVTTVETVNTDPTVTFRKAENLGKPGEKYYEKSLEFILEYFKNNKNESKDDAENKTKNLFQEYTTKMALSNLPNGKLFR